MLCRIEQLRPALISTLSTCDNLDVELTNADFKLIHRVVTVLANFNSATKMLSKSDASISQAIPIVTTIMEDLHHSKKTEDNGVKTLKKSLLASMKQRFDCYEDNDVYILATFLDP